MTTSRSDIKNSANWGFETKQVHIGQENPDPATGARAVPIYASTSFVFEDCRHAADRFALRDEGNIYGRLTNPTGEVFERRMAALEGGAAALAVSSGAAAVSYAIQALAKAGEHIVASRNIYGGTYHLLAHTLPLTAGITATFVDPEEEGAFEGAIQENTKAVFTETLGNPQFQCGGSGDTFKDRTQSSDPSGGGFHICDALPGAAHRVRSGYCGTLGDEIYRRAWDGPWRSAGRWRTV